jgi:putative hydrolase of the HAD superfamily
LVERNLPEAILLDLDDTIVSHSDGTEELWQKLCYQYAAMIEGLNPDVLYSAVREISHWYWSDFERHRLGRLNMKETRREYIALTFSKLGVENREVSNRLADAYTEQREDLVYLFPGAFNTLQTLKNQGIKLGLITNGTSETQRAKIEKFGLAPFFDCITIEGEFGQGKPEIEVFRHTLGKLNVKAAGAWMAGDDLARDIAGANNAGIYSIWIDPENRGLPEDSPGKPDRIIQSISRLLLT